MPLLKDGDGPSVKEVFGTDPKCADCRLMGGTTTKPGLAKRVADPFFDLKYKLVTAFQADISTYFHFIGPFQKF